MPQQIAILEKYDRNYTLVIDLEEYSFALLAVGTADEGTFKNKAMGGKPTESMAVTDTRMNVFQERVVVRILKPSQNCRTCTVLRNCCKS